MDATICPLCAESIDTVAIDDHMTECATELLEFLRDPSDPKRWF